MDLIFSCYSKFDNDLWGNSFAGFGSIYQTVGFSSSNYSPFSKAPSSSNGGFKWSLKLMRYFFQSYKNATGNGRKLYDTFMRIIRDERINLDAVVELNTYDDAKTGRFLKTSLVVSAFDTALSAFFLYRRTGRFINARRRDAKGVADKGEKKGAAFISKVRGLDVGKLGIPAIGLVVDSINLVNSIITYTSWSARYEQLKSVAVLFGNFSFARLAAVNQPDDPYVTSSNLTKFTDLSKVMFVRPLYNDVFSDDYNGRSPLIGRYAEKPDPRGIVSILTSYLIGKTLIKIPGVIARNGAPIITGLLLTTYGSLGAILKLIGNYSGLEELFKKIKDLLNKETRGNQDWVLPYFGRSKL